MNELASAILAALALGRIPHPVLLDGQLLTAQAQVAAAPPPEQGGWVFDGSSPIGAPWSRGVEALRQELIAAGSKRFADRIPRFHIVRFWRPPTAAFGFAQVDPNRFRRPVDTSKWPLSQQQWDNLCDNLWAYQNFLVSAGQLEGGSAYGARLRAQYRGEFGAPGFRAAADIDSRRGTLEKAVHLFNPNPFQAYLYERQLALDVDGNPVDDTYSVVPVTPLESHCIYDVWWAVEDDAAVTRFYRNWALSYGARISAEPRSRVP